uniref:Uncharacterized protein MANES_15G125200 n=1 Tax=Rhizophora mucronata TaxID=61149 RepID=A0A2P2MGN1_RHIMU
MLGPLQAHPVVGRNMPNCSLQLIYKFITVITRYPFLVVILLKHIRFIISRGPMFHEVGSWFLFCFLAVNV